MFCAILFLSEYCGSKLSLQSPKQFLVKQAHDRLRNEVFAWRMQTAHHNIYPFL